MRASAPPPPAPLHTMSDEGAPLAARHRASHMELGALRLPPGLSGPDLVGRAADDLMRKLRKSLGNDSDSETDTTSSDAPVVAAAAAPAEPGSDGAPCPRCSPAAPSLASPADTVHWCLLQGCDCCR
eukprot:TRINITY_DN14299_c0_g1_i1.p1 TRINITY_DN14299_c0_g1~~TRINITY_DN14299_c0_g1_i1.p1  ORF type:complete len:127 (+),score=24.91 TRINITY_DN14299_c0_g1_i1:33-413(+)